MRAFSKLKKVLIGLTVVGLLAGVPVAKALSEWGPDRPTFTMANPATYITFNSMTDNSQAIGDERHFYTANTSGVANYTHSLPVQDGQDIKLRVYFHNNAAANLNLVAQNTRVKMTLPASEAKDQASVAYISADNANPTQVWDTVHLTSDKAFTLEYVKGSARLFNNVFTGAGTALSDSIVTDSGAQVGFDAVNGRVPGCLNFSGYATITVKIHVPTLPPPPEKPKPPVTPPSNLVNTGPGEVAALFSGATVAGAAGYRMVLARRFRDED